MSRKPLSIFYIEYDESDPLSYALAWTVPLPYFIVVCFSLSDIHVYCPFRSFWSQIAHLAVLFFRRELWSAWTFAGYFVNEALNHVLKDIIKEPRPAGA